MLWKERKIKSEPPDLWIWRLAQCCHLTLRESKSTDAPTVVSAPPLRYDTQTFAAGSGFESRAAPGTVVCKELTSWQPSNRRRKELIWSFFNFILINWKGFIWDIKYMKIHFFLFLIDSPLDLDVKQWGVTLSQASNTTYYELQFKSTSTIVFSSLGPQSEQRPKLPMAMVYICFSKSDCLKKNK